jgi:SAM-dependent methyltransferase
MRTSFAESMLNSLLAEGTIACSDSVVSVCAGIREQEVFSRVGLVDATITNIDERDAGDRYAPFRYSYQDAHNLTFADGSFDFAFVTDGLHHCSAPHQALLEMYRVARKGIIVVESRDSLLMRTATRLGLSPEYEVEAVIGSEFVRGGTDNTCVPNYIYRWTEVEFEKTIRSFNPVGRHAFRFFYGLNLPYELAGWKKHSVKLRVIRVADPLLRGLTRLFKRQCNTLAMVALKPRIPDDLWPWLAVDDRQIVFNRLYADRHYKPIEGSGLSARPRDGTQTVPDDRPS